jgi:hypothetical protein
MELSLLSDCSYGYTHYVRFEIFKAVAMKNVICWDIKTRSVPHRRHVSATEYSQLIL